MRSVAVKYLVWGILALVLVAAWPQVMLFVMFAGYALLGPVERMFVVLTKFAGKQPPPKREVVEQKW